MSSNRLQLNGDNTEFMWLTTARRQQRLPTLGLTIGSTLITPCKAAHDLGVYIDADLTMRTHVQRTDSCCFATLRQLRTIRRSVPLPVFQLLVVALILALLDYCNSLLINLPVSLIQRLQSVQNAAARLIFNMRRSEHITDALFSLHWLRVPERIVFKVAMLTYRTLHGTAPPYRRLSLLVLLTCLTGEGCNLYRLISSTFRPSVCQLPILVRFRLLVLRSGTAYQMMLPPLHPCPPSGAV